MSGRNITLTTGANQVSQADLARLEREQQLQADQQRRAVRVVAAASLDTADCRMLLDVLGLERDAVIAARQVGTARQPQPPGRPTRRRRSRAA